MSYERQPYDRKRSMMRLTIEFWEDNTLCTTGMCSAGSALTVFHLRAEAGVPSLVLPIDIFGSITPHLGYEPIGIIVEQHSHRPEY